MVLPYQYDSILFSLTRGSQDNYIFILLIYNMEVFLTLSGIKEENKCSLTLAGRLQFLPKEVIGIVDADLCLVYSEKMRDSAVFFIVRLFLYTCTVGQWVGTWYEQITCWNQVLAFTTSIEPDQAAHPSSLTRLYTVGWPTSSFPLDIPKMIIDIYRTGRWNIPVKKFSKLRVNLLSTVK